MSSEDPPPSSLTRLVNAGLTDVGRQRKHNEDCVLLRPEHNLFAVADGMGGHNAGDVASKIVAATLGEYFDATANGTPVEVPDDYAALSLEAKRLAAGVRKANHTVHTVSNTQQQHHGMGSTVVAIHFSDGMVHIAHVGDSRCYRIRDGHIQQMTRDHSLINDALDMKPDLTKEELSRLPKNIITRALGMKDVVKVDVKSEPVQLGDTFLLCSDGLTGMVPPEQILEVVNLTPDPHEACELLIAEANDAGGTDNISAILVRLEEALPEHVYVEEHELEIGADDDHELAAASAPGLEIGGVAHFEDADLDETPSTPGLDVSEVAELAELADLDEGGEADVGVADMPPLDDEQVAELVAAFARGEAVDLDLVGPWRSRLTLRRCARCSHELYPGNSFCTECGARIESASAS